MFKLNSWKRVKMTSTSKTGKLMVYKAYLCPKCDNEVIVQTNYCPRCGKKLKRAEQ